MTEFREKQYHKSKRIDNQLYLVTKSISKDKDTNKLII